MSLLRDVCSNRKTLDYLRSHGLSELSQLLEYPICELQRHPDRWSGLEHDLRNLAEAEESYRERIFTYLSTAPQLVREVANPYTGKLLPWQWCARFLARQGRPQPWRRVRARLRKEGITLAGLEELQIAESGLKLYTLGHHRWVSLTEWGSRGARLVAESSWPIMPLWLESLIVSQRQAEIAPELWEVFGELAERDGYDHLVQLIQTLLCPATPVKSLPARKIFTDLELSATFDVVVQKVIVHAKALPRPFSLAELRISQGDLEWLKTWFTKVKATRARHWLQSWQVTRRYNVWRWSDLEAFGLIFLLLVSEIARRDALPGKLWSYVAQRIPDKLAAELFVQEQPSGLVRQAIEAACRRFRVRHTFGLEGVQMWYQTVFLQFGLSFKAIAGLGLWLEQPDLMPAGIGRLYDQSESFQQLWRAMRNYREQPIATHLEALKLVMKDSPFVLPDWHEQVIHWTTAQPQTPAKVLQSQTYWARLEWSSAGPRFWIDPAAMAADLDDIGYQVVHNHQILGQLELEPMGYACHPPRLYFDWQAELQVTLVADSDATCHSRVVRMLDSDELGQLYHLDSGEYLWGESWCRDACALLLPEGYTTDPPATTVQSLGKSCPDLHRFNQGLPSSCQILYRGQELTNIDQESQLDGLGCIQVKAMLTTAVSLPAQVELSILGLSNDSELRWVRRGHVEVGFERAVLGYNLKISLDADLDSSSVRLLLGIRHKQKMYRIQRSVSIPIYDMTWYSGQTWVSMHNLFRLTVEQAQQLRFRFFGAGEKPHTFALFEGDVFSRSLSNSRQELGRLGGYGDALYIHRGQFNHLESATLIAQQVVNTGKIDRVESLSRNLSIHFVQPLEADEDFEIIGWDGDGEVFKYAALNWQYCSSWCWSGGWTGPDGCIGVANRGVRLGSWWTEELKFPFVLKKPSLWAAMIRWLNFPLLSPNWETAVRKLAQQYPVECLKSWLLETSLSEWGLVHSEGSETWNAVLRKLYAGWHPKSQDEADAILSEIGAHRLLTVNSLLLSRCLEAAFPDAAQEWLRCAAELAGCEQVSDLEKLEQELSRQAAADLGPEIDPHFIDKLCERMLTSPSERDKDNFKLANRVHPFRLLFCIRNLRRNAEKARRGSK